MSGDHPVIKSLPEVCRDYVALLSEPKETIEQELDKCWGRVRRVIGDAEKQNIPVKDYNEAIEILWPQLLVGRLDFVVDLKVDKVQKLSLGLFSDLIGHRDYINKTQGHDIGNYLHRMLTEIVDHTHWDGINLTSIKNKGLY